jgi:hypothetical protein
MSSHAEPPLALTLTTTTAQRELIFYNFSLWIAFPYRPPGNRSFLSPFFVACLYCAKSAPFHAQPASLALSQTTSKRRVGRAKKESARGCSHTGQRSALFIFCQKEIAYDWLNIRRVVSMPKERARSTSV